MICLRPPLLFHPSLSLFPLYPRRFPNLRTPLYTGETFYTIYTRSRLKAVNVHSSTIPAVPCLPRSKRSGSHPIHLLNILVTIGQVILMMKALFPTKLIVLRGPRQWSRSFLEEQSPSFDRKRMSRDLKMTLQCYKPREMCPGLRVTQTLVKSQDPCPYIAQNLDRSLLINLMSTRTQSTRRPTHTLCQSTPRRDLEERSSESTALISSSGTLCTSCHWC